MILNNISCKLIQLLQFLLFFFGLKSTESLLKMMIEFKRKKSVEQETGRRLPTDF